LLGDVGEPARYPHPRLNIEYFAACGKRLARKAPLSNRFDNDRPISGSEKRFRHPNSLWRMDLKLAAARAKMTITWAHFSSAHSNVPRSKPARETRVVTRQKRHLHRTPIGEGHWIPEAILKVPKGAAGSEAPAFGGEFNAIST
jgi:hypothetical protein